MDFLRRNTDYSLRLMVGLATRYKQGTVSAKVLSLEADVPHQLTSKLLQKLTKAGFIRSVMGVNGGFFLNVEPSQVNILEIIETIQGPISLNRCMLGKDLCDRSDSCPITIKLDAIQEELAGSLRNVTLSELVEISKKISVKKAIAASISGKLE